MSVFTIKHPFISDKLCSVDSFQQMFIEVKNLKIVNRKAAQTTLSKGILPAKHCYNNPPVINCIFQQHPFNGPLSRTTQVSRYQKGKTSPDLLDQESEWQWYRLGYMQICTSPQITMPAPHHSFFIGRMPFLPPNQQHQTT